MDWEKWDWFFGPDAVRRPDSDGTEPEEDSGREAGDENGIW